MENPNGRGGGVTIMEIRGHGGMMHFGNSEGRGGVKIWKPSVVWYGYFLEFPIAALDTWFSKNFTEICTAVLLVFFLTLFQCQYW